jgi:hypothetical protein
MSEEEFHVHGAHEHIGHAEGHPAHGLAQYVAIFTALMSTLGAVVSYQSATNQNEAMTLIQIAIALASVTALTRQRWLFAVGGIAAAAAIGLWISALLA